MCVRVGLCEPLPPPPFRSFKISSNSNCLFADTHLSYFRWKEKNVQHCSLWRVEKSFESTGNTPACQHNPPRDACTHIQNTEFIRSNSNLALFLSHCRTHSLAHFAAAPSHKWAKMKCVENARLTRFVYIDVKIRFIFFVLIFSFVAERTKLPETEKGNEKSVLFRSQLINEILTCSRNI